MARRSWNTEVEITLIPLGKRARSEKPCVSSPPPKRVAEASTTLPHSAPPHSPPESTEQKNVRLERELASARAHNARLRDMVKEEKKKREQAEQRMLRWQLQTQKATSLEKSGWKAYHDLKRKHNLE